MNKQRLALIGVGAVVVVGITAGLWMVNWLTNHTPGVVARAAAEEIVHQSSPYLTADGRICSDLVITWADARDSTALFASPAPEDYRTVWLYDGSQLSLGEAADVTAALDCSNTYVYLLAVRQISTDTALVDVFAANPRSTTIGFECGGGVGDRWTLALVKGAWVLVIEETVYFED